MNRLDGRSRFSLCRPIAEIPKLTENKAAPSTASRLPSSFLGLSRPLSLPRRHPTPSSASVASPTATKYPGRCPTSDKQRYPTGSPIRKLRYDECCCYYSLVIFHFVAILAASEQNLRVFAHRRSLRAVLTSLLRADPSLKDLRISLAECG